MREKCRYGHYYTAGCPFLYGCAFLCMLFTHCFIAFPATSKKKVSYVDLITNTTTATDCSSCDHVKYEILQLGDKKFMSTNAIYDISLLSHFFCWSNFLARASWYDNKKHINHLCFHKTTTFIHVLSMCFGLFCYTYTIYVHLFLSTLLYLIHIMQLTFNV